MMKKIIKVISVYIMLVLQNVKGSASFCMMYLICLCLYLSWGNSNKLIYYKNHI
jgi:hypothetical protein